MNAEDFRRIALALPAASESAHMEHPDFRVGGRIFATLSQAEDYGVVMLSPEEQAEFIRTAPAAFAPVNGGWGRRGATEMRLQLVKEATAQRALATAWQRKAPKRLTTKHA